MNEKLRTILFMIAVSAVFTGLVSGVYIFTRPRIRANARLALNRAIINAYDPDRLPKGAGGAQVEEAFEQYVRETDITWSPAESRELPGASREEYPVYEGLDESGRLAAYIFEIRGRGLWGDIRGFLSVSPDLQQIVGISFYMHSETPGLGAEMTKEWFRQAFVGTRIPAEPGPEGRYIDFVPRDSELGDNDVHAITGATGTTNALRTFVNQDLDAFLRVMEKETDKTPPSDAEETP
jgi:Na+-transporting NADH:ubiquinone oxidoreductase subunit NqrC